VWRLPPPSSYLYERDFVRGLDFSNIIRNLDISCRSIGKLRKIPLIYGKHKTVKMADDEHRPRVKFGHITGFILYRSVYLLLLLSVCVIFDTSAKEDCKGIPCDNGYCIENNTQCKCYDGWSEPTCSHCKGRTL